ncbi:MAG: hypothetical protein K8R48_07380 [Alphaproteobacteria bacterium]|nr:hypothetical protein [Alphaproteobacteria bacterium]
MQVNSIHGIPRKGAFSSKENASTWVHIFTSYGIPASEFQTLYKKLMTSGDGQLHLPRPIWMAFSDLENFSVPQIHFEAFSGQHGEMILYQHNYDVILPKSNFVYLSTPYRDGEKIYDDAEAILEKIRGISCLLFGRNFLYQKIMSAEIYNHPSNRIEQISKSTKIFAIADGPYVGVNNLHELEEIAKAIAEIQDEDERRRVDSAIHYFVRGIENSDTFLYFWTATEILCGKKENNVKFIQNALQAIYPGFDVNQFFGFKQLKGLRDNWLHRGIIPDISSDTIRYLQLMFLDLLRYKAGLATKNHLQAICSSADFNLSDIGLSSNGLGRDRGAFRWASPEERKIRSSLWCKAAIESET